MNNNENTQGGEVLQQQATDTVSVSRPLVRLKTFALLFYTELGQVLVTKDTDEETDKPCLQFQVDLENVRLKMSFGFANEEVRDEAFDETDEVKALELARNLLETFDQLTKPDEEEAPQTNLQQGEAYTTTDKSEGGVN